METLHTIKARSTTINNLSKALDAIKMVSSVKLSKVAKTDHCHGGAIAQDSLSLMLGILCRYVSRFCDIDNDVLHNKMCCGSSLVVVFSSSQGFCGPLNNLISNEFKKLRSSLHGDMIVEVCGTKHKQYASSHIIDIKNMHMIDESVHVVMDNIRYHVQRGVSSVYIVHAEPRNSLVQVAKTNRLLPFESDPDRSDCNYIADNILVEGDPVKMYSDMLNMYMLTSVRSLVHNHVIAELSARVASLDSSVSNANDIYHQLNLQYNKTRQAKITQELTEIISSMECMG